MGFKTLLQKIPYWLKFAILFGSAFCLFSIGPLLENESPGLLGPESGSGEFGSYSMAVFVLLTFPIIALTQFALMHGLAINFYLYWCLSVIYFFIIGSIMGIVIQAIKLKITKKIGNKPKIRNKSKIREK